MLKTTTACLVGLLALLTIQDPQKVDPTRPTPPAEAPPLPPVQEPFREEVERHDLLQRFGGPSPLAGFYELRSFARTGASPVPTRGYLAIGRRHLSIHLQTAVGEVPALQTGFRSYRIDGDRLHTTTLLGFRNETGGDVYVDKPGTSHVCMFRRSGTRLSLELEGGRILEFERLE